MGYLSRAAVAAIVLLLLTPATQAQVSPLAGYTAFTLTTMDDDPATPGTATMMLQSDAGGSTVFALPGMEATLDVLSGGVVDLAEYQLALGIVPRSGYTIIGFELAGTLSGELGAGVAPPGAIEVRQGSGFNSASLDFVHGDLDLSLSNLNGSQAFSLMLGAGDAIPGPAGTLNIVVQGLVSGRAEYTSYSTMVNGTLTEGRAGSTAALSIVDPTLTVYWAAQPVPEPQAWVMLLAGMVPVVVAGGLRKDSRA